MSEIAALTRRLVEIPSNDGEAAAGDAVEAWLREHTDAAVTRDDAGADEGRGGNVIARRPAGAGAGTEGEGTGAGGDAGVGTDGSGGPETDGDAPSLALVGHHDVVPPDDDQVAADGTYAVAERDGRLYGRGSADMKGAVAAAMLAFRDADPAGELVFASFVGEEVGGVGARHAIDRGFAPDCAVVAEGSTGYSAPGTTDVAVAHRGRRASTLVARGTAAHASEPDAGENAVYRACEAVSVVRSLDPPSARVEAADATATGSVTVTEVHGGTAWNVVPDECAVTVDERTVPGGRADLGRVETVEGVEWTVEQDLPPMECDDPAFAGAVLSAAGAAQDGTPGTFVKPHATDAGWLAAAGTTCVVCGPAEPGEAHTDDESVSVAVLERCRDVYRRVAEATW